MSKGFKRFLKFSLIIAIIISIAIPVGKLGFRMLNEKKQADVQTDILLVQARVKVIKGKADVKATTDGFIGTKVSEADNGKIKDLLKQIGVAEEQFEKYYIYSSQDLDNIGIKNELKNNADNLYVVNYDEAEVIYTKGINVDGIKKYKFSDIVKTPEKKDWVLHNRMLE